MRFTTASLALAASASVVAGKAIVVNNCNFDAQLVSVADQQGPVQQLPAHGGRYEENFQTRSNGAGCSLKISRSGGSDVAQFEYTLDGAGSYVPGVWWDLSLIDGAPFAGSDITIVPTVLSSGADTTTCQAITCPEGKNCAAAYLKWNDDHATHHCPTDTDLTYYMCGTGSGSSAPASSPAPSAAPSPSPTPAPSPSPSPSPSPAPAPAASPSPVAQQLNQKPAESPAAASPAPAAPAPPRTGYAVSVQEGSNRLMETPLKREAHANHIERHNRIRRMHHARSVA